MPIRSVSGFTLIELIVVIAILAILAATAIPKFVDLRVNAAAASAQGGAAALASGSSINFGARVAGNLAATAVATCGNAELTLQGNAFPTGFSFKTGVGARTVGNGAMTVCSIIFDAGGGVAATVPATIIGAT